MSLLKTKSMNPSGIRTSNIRCNPALMRRDTKGKDASSAAGDHQKLLSTMNE